MKCLRGRHDALTCFQSDLRLRFEKLWRFNYFERPLIYPILFHVLRQYVLWNKVHLLVRVHFEASNHSIF